MSKHPPLHVELSTAAHGWLGRIMRRRAWNKKTTVEQALRFYELHGDRLDFAPQPSIPQEAD